MNVGDALKVHAEYAADNSGWCHQARNNCHYFHYLVHAEVHLIQVKVLDAGHDIAVVFHEVIGLHNVVIHIFEIFCNAVLHKISFAAEKTIDHFPHRADVAL